MYILDSTDLSLMIMKEFLMKPFWGHPKYHKMVILSRKQCYWHGMKREITYFIARCIECQKFKIKYQHLAGLLQPLPIP